MSVKIPSDVDREDRLVAGLTARQLGILAAAGLLLYGLWHATGDLVPPPVFLGVAGPLATAVVIVVVFRRDGISLDRWLLAAARHACSPRRRVHAPEGIPDAPTWATSTTTNGRARDAHATHAASPLEFPVTAMTDAGVIDLGADGLAAVAACSTVNFALLSPAEQDALTAAFGRYLHSLSAPAQLLVRVQRIDLTDQVVSLRHRAAALPHPALERAALGHADFLSALSREVDLLQRQVLLVLHEPAGLTSPAPRLDLLGALRARRRAPIDHQRRQAAEARLVRRLAEAASLLSAAGITVTPLDVGQATAVLAHASDPDSVTAPAGALAAPDDVITTAPLRDDPPDDAAPAHDADTSDDTSGEPLLEQFRERYSR